MISRERKLKIKKANKNIKYLVFYAEHIQFIVTLMWGQSLVENYIFTIVWIFTAPIPDSSIIKTKTTCGFMKHQNKLDPAAQHERLIAIIDHYKLHSKDNNTVDNGFTRSELAKMYSGLDHLESIIFETYKISLEEYIIQCPDQYKLLIAHIISEF